MAKRSKKKLLAIWSLVAGFIVSVLTGTGIVTKNAAAQGRGSFSSDSSAPHGALAPNIAASVVSAAQSCSTFDAEAFFGRDSEGKEEFLKFVEEIGTGPTIEALTLFLIVTNAACPAPQ